MTMDKPVKPLGFKAYGSIPHLPGSRLGPGDHHCHAGQDAIVTSQLRDKHDHVEVTLKLDGSCCAIARIGEQIHALGRAGYPAASSPHVQHHLFAEWVEQRKARLLDVLNPGERFVGEWMAMAHGTIYPAVPIEAAFVVFDLFAWKNRQAAATMRRKAAEAHLTSAPIIALGPTRVADAMEIARNLEFFGTRDHEGVVYRCERKGRFDFLAKYVREDKVDGKYFGEETVWHIPGGSAYIR